MGKRTGRSVSDVTRTPRQERLKFHKYSKGPVLPFTHARVVEEESVETRMGVRPMQREELPDWLPWDLHLNYVLSEVQNKMHPTLPEGFFYCFCREPCKVGLTKRLESPNRGRCFLTCAQKNAQHEGCHFFQWIDEAWGPWNNDLQMTYEKDMIKGQ